MGALQDTRPDQAAFYINLFNKAKAAYTKLQQWYWQNGQAYIAYSANKKGIHYELS